jgi:hypothetical protein
MFAAAFLHCLDGEKSAGIDQVRDGKIMISSRQRATPAGTSTQALIELTNAVREKSACSFRAQVRFAVKRAVIEFWSVLF